MSKKRWEYNIVDANNVAESLEMLGPLGIKGWEVTNAILCHDGRYIFFLKRKFRGKRNRLSGTYSIEVKGVNPTEGEVQQ